jgi:hypothetical protein
MTIQDTLDSLNKKQSEYGWTVLAQRVPQSEDAPHKIALVKDAIKPNEPVVLILPGTGAEIISCNGLLKRVHDFIKNNDKTCQARICVAIYDYEQKYIQNLARAALIVNKRFPVLWFLLKNIGHHPWTCSDSEYAKLNAIYDIYNSVVLPKITDKDGKKLPIQQLLKNIRTLTIIGYCAGGHFAMKLEEIIKKEMFALGYSNKEINTALGQIPVIGYAMNAPSEKSDLKFFNFNSVSDDQNMDSAFKRYLYFETKENEFDLMHFSNNRDDTFYCQSLNKKTVWVCQEINAFLKQQEELAKIELHEDHIESKEDSYRQHSFIGFVEKNGFSDGAKQLQAMFKSIVSKSVENSVNNSKSAEFIPLPETIDLIDDNIDEYGKSNVVYMRENTKYQIYKPFYVISNVIKMRFWVMAARFHKRKQY